jgi:hypothetical protein
MSKTNGKAEEVVDENVVRVGSPLSLPYAYIPYYSVSDARKKAADKNSGLDPNKTLYVFEPGVPVGYRIVAYPILMNKPEPETQEGWATDGE